MRALLEKMIADAQRQVAGGGPRDIERDKFLTADQAIEYGLIDDVLQPLKTPVPPASDVAAPLRRGDGVAEMGLSRARRVRHRRSHNPAAGAAFRPRTGYRRNRDRGSLGARPERPTPLGPWFDFA